MEAMGGQKQNADKNGRVDVLIFSDVDLVLLSTVNLPQQIVTCVISNKLQLKFIGTFTFLNFA